jgi:NSS family neurotransmitter:Na+ symporter
VFSFNIWSDITPLYMFETFRDKTIFDLLDYLTANIMLPLGGLLIAIFSVWIMHEDASVDELAMGEGLTYQIWHLLVRYLTPIAVIIVFLRAIEVI